MNKQVKAFMQSVADRNPNEPEFLQAVLEVAEVIVPFTSNYPDIQSHASWRGSLNLSVSSFSGFPGWTTRGMYRSIADTVFR